MRRAAGSVLVLLAIGSPAFAQEVYAPLPPPPAQTGLTGDWGGLRSRMASKGLSVSGGYTSESAANIAGGVRRDIAEAGQFTLGLKADMSRFAHIPGGEVQVTVTGRRGEDLGQVAGLGVLQQVQEIYGRGQTVRLTQFWYEQRFSIARLKLGRSSPGEDFAAFSCDFENLSLCGAAPGNIVGDYWFNSPISQWSTRLRLGRGGTYVQAGAYEVNPRNLDKSFTLGRLHGAKGVLTPIEFGWSPRSSRRARAYKIGAWRSTASGADLRAPTTARSRRYGGWVDLQQQFTGEARDGVAVSGLSGFFNFTQADRATSRIDQQVSAGLSYIGLFPSRPADTFGLGVARTNVNGRGLGAPADGMSAPRAPKAEYSAEAFYNFRPRSWLQLSPNVQIVRRPGALANTRNILVLGLKAGVAL